MSKPPSDATKLKTAQRDLRDTLTLLNSARDARDGYRLRATRAEQEVSEWKARFDALLARTPPEKN